MRAFFEGLVLLAAVVVYFLPAIVADAREREDAFALTIFNVLFGWTVIGWIAAFVWARHRVSDRRLANLASNTRPRDDREDRSTLAPGTRGAASVDAIRVRRG